MSKMLSSLFKLRLVLLSAVLLLTACASQLTHVQDVALNKDISYTLQPIPEDLHNIGILALFNVEQQGKENEFLVQVEMTKSHLAMSGLTAEGLSLFNLDWNIVTAQLNYDKNIAIEPLRVLAELQLVLWPEASLLQGLTQATLTTKANNEREIRFAKQVIYRIHQQAEFSQLMNLERDYTITIKELERWTIPANHIESKEQKHMVEN